MFYYTEQHNRLYCSTMDKHRYDETKWAEWKWINTHNSSYCLYVVVCGSKDFSLAKEQQYTHLSLKHLEIYFVQIYKQCILRNETVYEIKRYKLGRTSPLIHKYEVDYHHLSTVRETINRNNVDIKLVDTVCS